MYIASNDIKKPHASSGLKNLCFQNTLMTSHECGATLIAKECENILIAIIITWFKNHILFDTIHAGMFDNVHYII